MSFWNNFNNKKKNNNNLISAHRGFRSIRAENTMASFKAAIGKCDFIELDVGFSKDGVAIIIHDDTLDRTSNCKNIPEFKSPYNNIDYTYQELLKLDFSSWFIETDPFKTIKRGIVKKEILISLDIERIPTLIDVLRLLKESNTPVNIEIKDLEKTPFHKIALKSIVKIIRDEQMEKLTLLSSFQHEYIREAIEYCPEITRAALQEDENPQNLVQYLRELGVEDYNVDFDILNKEIIDDLIKANIRVNVFTVNKQKDKDKLFEYGVNSIFTDFL